MKLLEQQIVQKEMVKKANKALTFTKDPVNEFISSFIEEKLKQKSDKSSIRIKNPNRHCPKPVFHPSHNDMKVKDCHSLN